MLDNAKHEIDMVMDTIEEKKKPKGYRIRMERKGGRVDGFSEEVGRRKRFFGKRVKKFVNLLKETEEEALACNEESTQMKNLLKEAESEVNYLKQVLGDAKAVSMSLKESLIDKENEVQSLDQEIFELKTREAENLKKVEDLMKLLEEKAAKEKIQENDDVSDSEKDYDMLPKVVEFSEHNGDAKIEHSLKEKPLIEEEDGSDINEGEMDDPKDELESENEELEHAAYEHDDIADEDEQKYHECV